MRYTYGSATGSSLYIDNYDASFGRFLNADDPQMLQYTKNTQDGLNLFAYCNNDPINNTDPTGRYALSSLMNVLSSSINVIISLLEYLMNSSEKQLTKFENLKKTVRGLSNSQKNQKKIFKEIYNESKKLKKSLGRVGLAISIIAVVYGLASAFAKGVKLSFLIAQFIAEIATTVITELASWLCGRIAKLIPGFGFILKTFVSLGVSLLLSRYFTDARINKIANRIVFKGNKYNKLSAKTLFKLSLQSVFS